MLQFTYVLQTDSSTGSGEMGYKVAQLDKAIKTSMDIYPLMALVWLKLLHQYNHLNGIHSSLHHSKLAFQTRPVVISMNGWGTPSPSPTAKRTNFIQYKHKERKEDEMYVKPL